MSLIKNIMLKSSLRYCEHSLCENNFGKKCYMHKMIEPHFPCVRDDIVNFILSEVANITDEFDSQGEYERYVGGLCTEHGCDSAMKQQVFESLGIKLKNL